MSVPVACEGCAKEEPQISMCRIRSIQFKVFGKPCPREQGIGFEPTTITTTPQVEEYDLTLSKEKLGPLIPILTDAYGNIIDGFHRQRVDPDWPKLKAEHITDPVQLTMARLASNVCRRNVPPEEKRKLLANIAELTGWTPKEIVQNTGFKKTFVYKYLPEKYKEKSWQRETPIPRRGIAHKHVKNNHSFEETSITPTVPVKKTDTGFLFECPCCDFKGLIIHIDPSKKHILQKVRKDDEPKQSV